MSPDGAPEKNRRTLLVIGAHGFIGAHVLAAASRSPDCSVIGIDRESTAGRGRKLLDSLGCGGVEVAPADLDEPGALTRFLVRLRPDVIVHAAGLTERGSDPASWVRSIQGNVMPVAALVASVGAVTSIDGGNYRPAVVVPGSQMEYGSAPMPWMETTTCMPANAYGLSKLLATEALRAARRAGILRGTVVRFPIVFGPGQAPSMLIPEIIIGGLSGRAVPMTEGIQSRRFVSADDAAAQLLAVGARLDGPEGDSVPDLVNAAGSAPERVIDVAGRIETLIPGCVTLPGKLPMRADEPLAAWPETDPAVAERLGLERQIGLDKELAATIAWYRRNDWFWKSDAR